MYPEIAVKVAKNHNIEVSIPKVLTKAKIRCWTVIHKIYSGVVDAAHFFRQYANNE